MRKLIFIFVLALSSCKPVYSMGGHVNCRPLSLPSDVREWDYVGRNATTSGHGEWYDDHGRLFGYAWEEDSPIYRSTTCQMKFLPSRTQVPK